MRHRFFPTNKLLRGGAVVTTVVTFIAACVAIRSGSTAPLPATNSPAVYDADPHHLWNRLYDALLVRTTPDGKKYGVDRLDPLLWANSKYLFSGTAYQVAIQTLDEFLVDPAVLKNMDVLHRALFQQDLWSVLEWSAEPLAPADQMPARRALQRRLALAMAKIALSADQIQHLPDNYAAAVASGHFAAHFDPAHPGEQFLPSGLFDNDSSVCLNSVIHPGSTLNPQHVAAFGGRSIFFTFLRLPNGRAATLRYLETVRTFPDPITEGGLLNPALPPPPPDTELALVRQAMLIDDKGNLTPTHITQEIQFRVLTAGPAADQRQKAGLFLDAQLSRRDLFTNKDGGLHLLAPDEKDFTFVQFGGKGVDWIDATLARPDWGSVEDLRPVLGTCYQCHFGDSTNSIQGMRSLVIPRDSGNRHGPPNTPDAEAANTILWKKQQYSWALLQGILIGQPK